MPRPRLGAVNVLTLADVALVTNAETVVATISNVNTQSADEKVSILGSVIVTTGANATAINARVRRGTDTTGTLLGESFGENVTAGDTRDLAIAISDTPGEVAGQTYVITCQQTNATANATVTSSDIQVLIGT